MASIPDHDKQDKDTHSFDIYKSKCPGVGGKKKKLDAASCLAHSFRLMRNRPYLIQGRYMAQIWFTGLVWVLGNL